MASGGDSWQDRRGMFQSGKHVHEPAKPGGRKFSETGSITAAMRRASASSGSGGPGSPDKAEFPTSGSGGRRRSSAASNGLFGNLMTQKRGGEDYAERRTSHNEMMNQGGMVSGWFNSTFKGYQKPDPSVAAASQQKKEGGRGVME